MVGILYIVLFILTIILEVLIIRKTKNKRWLWLIIYFALYIIGAIIGSLIGNSISYITHDFLMASLNLEVSTIYGFICVPICVLVFLYLYKIKKLNLPFTIIFIVESLGISLGTFFLLLIG